MAVVISIVSYKFLPPKLGGQKAIAFFMKYFSRYVQLFCATVASNENTYAEGYTVVPVFSTSGFRYINPLYVFRLKKLVKQYKASHVLIEHPYMGWMAVLLKRLTGTKLIVRSHNIEGLRFKTIGKWWWKILWKYEGFVHRRADYNFFIQDEDRNYAIANFGLAEQKCFTLTYGIEMKAPPPFEEISSAKEYVCREHNISPNERILLFAGAFNYKPNVDAFNAIDKIIAPLLEAKNFTFRILICGMGLDKNASTNSNVMIVGFVNDIGLYFKAADVFINPTVDGGGIKTKLVEALGFNANAVSTANGAIGVDPRLCGGKLVIAKDNDWETFTDAVITASAVRANTPQEYYQHFNWDQSTKRAAAFIDSDA